MLSIIICSRTQTINKDLSDNIKNMVGCEYELIVIDNSENTYSIFEAYNLGMDKSSGGFLCFIHDDILFHTKDWGNTIQRIFSTNQQVGLIGIAGAKSKTKLPSLWWSCPNVDKVAFIIQHFPDRETERWNQGFEQGFSTSVEVEVIDGVFMVLRKNECIRFNEEMKGFHNYDLNLSFECKKLGHKIMITNEILIEHFSLGTIKEDWIESSYQLYALYKSSWSLCLKRNKTKKKQEIDNAIWFINECLKFKKYRIAVSIWRELFYLNPFLMFHLIYWKNNLKNNTDVLFQYFRKK